MVQRLLQEFDQRKADRKRDESIVSGIILPLEELRRYAERSSAEGKSSPIVLYFSRGQFSGTRYDMTPSGIDITAWSSELPESVVTIRGIKGQDVAKYITPGIAKEISRKLVISVES